MWPGRRDAKNDRICVLAGRALYFEPLPGRACEDRIHSHLSRAKVDELVGDGQAEWIQVEYLNRKQEVKKRNAPAVRLVPRRSWKGKLSTDERGSMKVMQLVN